MSKVSKFDFVFFVALWVNLINYFKPTAGWPYFPDVIDALVPAVGALGSHVTMLAIMALKLPTEDQVRTWATLRSQKRRNKKAA